MFSKLHPALARFFIAPLFVSSLLAWFVWYLIPLQKMHAVSVFVLHSPSSLLSFLFCFHRLLLHFLPIHSLMLHNLNHKRLSFPISPDCVSSDVFLTIHPVSSSIKAFENLQTKTCPELCCLPLKKRSSVTAENHRINGVRTINMLYWTHNDSPLRILPSQYSKWRHCTNNVQECLCARHKAETWLLKEKMRMPQSWLTSVFRFERRTRDATKRQMWFLRCGYFLTLRSDVRSSWIIGITQTVKKMWRLIFQSTVTTHPTTNSSTNHPIASEDEEDGCACCSSCMKFLQVSSSCFCSRSLTICIAKWYSVCCITSRSTSAFCSMFNLPQCICSRNGRDCWYSALSPNSLSHANIPNLSFSRFTNASSFAQRSTHFFEKKTSVWWLGRRHLWASH